MSVEYIMLQYENDMLKRENEKWMKLISEAHVEIEGLKHTFHYMQAECDEYCRNNERIWETTKRWIQEDSAIISKQAGQIQYLTKRLRILEPNRDFESNGSSIASNTVEPGKEKKGVAEGAIEGVDA
jgi:hypothetical protein